MRFRTRAGLTAAAAAITLVVAACGGAEPADRGGAASAPGELTTLRIGLVPIVHVAALMLGQEKGFFEQEGIRLEVQYASSSATIVPSIMSEDLELGYGNITSTILARAAGLPIVSVASADTSSLDPEVDTNAVIVRTDSPYRTAADLEGRTVAVNALQASNYVTVRASADQLGAESSRYKFVEVPFPDMLSALATGRVDAATVSEPFVTQAQRSGDYRVLYYNHNIAGTRPGNLTDTYFTSEAVLAKSGNAIEAFRRAITKANGYASANPDEARAQLLQYTQIAPDTVPEVVLPNWSTEPVPREDIEFMLRKMQDYGLFRGDVPAYSDVVRE
ncbi:ABC transporter substrate-binding protein [Pseudonocardia bannensis]|uniref:ABC transporter substrate-binding protein n=1 Tax=Pseudonocardia bannensis TaxID=630973 RepID=A0A848DNQ9_9PSEU|nr:ABC transporter substrate-binding protein [Pseudonocardia bannensis]NMH94460.1 ABC transporter substrate-binding protein [Pseudonocardia bannensis]